MAGIVYMLAWPVPIDPAPWRPPVAPPLEGDFAVNDRLAGIQRLGEGLAPKPEDVAFDAQGRLYTGYEDGRILRWDAQRTRVEEFANTGGRPLGLKFDARGNLIVADSYDGLIAIDPTGKITVLATECDGLPFRFTDDLDIAADGTIFFSDASWKYGQTRYLDDIIEHRPNGRLLRYDPATGRTTQVLGDLYFANGVAVSPDQQYLLVVETGCYRVRRYWLAGEKAGETDILIDNLPGFPDGITAGSAGVFWIAMANPRNPLLDGLMPLPFARKMLMRLPAFLRPKPERYSFVLGIDGSGKIVHNLQAPSAPYAPITNVVEHENTLYFGSIEEGAVGYLPMPALAQPQPRA
jgi:sugar lactone lactonase YvrE